MKAFKNTAFLLIFIGVTLLLSQDAVASTGGTGALP